MPTPAYRYLSRGAALTALAGIISCSLTPQGREAKHMASGKAYRDKKQYKRAAIEFRVALQNAEKDPAPHYELGLVYAATGAFSLAVPQFEKALSLNPRHLNAEYQLARIRVSSNAKTELEQAEKSLNRFLQVEPDNSEALASLAIAEVKMGKGSGAMEHFNRSLSKDPGNISRVSTMLMVQLSRRDLPGARETARLAVQRMPKSPEAALLMAKMLLMSGDETGAEGEIARSLTLQPKFQPALELRLALLAGKQQTGAAEKTAQALSGLPGKGMAAAYPYFLLREGKVEPALQEFRRLMGEHPDDTTLMDQFAAVLLGLKRQKEAESVVASTLKKSHADPDALLMQASMRIDSRDYDIAEKILNQVQAAAPSSAAAYYQRSRIYAARGQTRQEGDLLVEALRRNRRLLQARLELARLLIEAGNWKAAMPLLNGLSESERAAPLCRFYRAGAFIAAENWPAARKEIDLGLATQRTAALLNLDASLRLREKDTTGARKSLEEGLKADPANIPSLRMLGVIYGQLSQGSQFVTLVRDLAAKNPQFPELQLFQGQQLFAEGDRSGARAAWESAKKTDAHFVAADVALASIDLQEHATEKARQRLLASTSIRDSATARDALGAIEENSGNWEMAAQHYRKALEMAPADALAMNNLASVLSQHLGKVDEGLTYAERAKILTPTDPFLEDTLGCIYLKKNKVASALAHLQASAKLFDRAAVRYHLAAAYLKSGDRGKAESEYQAAVRLDPKSPERPAVSGEFKN